MESRSYEPSRETKIDLKSRVARETAGTTTITERTLQGSAPPWLSLKRGHSFRDILVRAKIRKRLNTLLGVVHACQLHFRLGEFGSSYRRVRSLLAAGFVL